MHVKTNVSLDDASGSLHGEPILPSKSGALRLSVLAPWAILLILAFLPYLLQALDAEYYLGFVRRILIVSMAAASLNLLVGYGGMVTLGQASFVGVGAYTIAALAHAGFTLAWGMLGAAMLSSAVVAVITAFIVLRTRGVYFIMVSMACAQLLYYLAVSLRIYGSDDGYNLPEPLNLGFGWTNMDDVALYWVVLVVAVVCFVGLNHILNSRFGIALNAVRDNESRMRALGYSVSRIQLAAFVFAGTIAGLSGALLIMHNQFVTPSVMHWSQSANLLVMVVLGGLGYRWGGVVGVVIWLLLEEFLRQITTHWHWPLGLILIGIVLVAPRGVCSLTLAGLLRRSSGGGKNNE